MAALPVSIYCVVGIIYLAKDHDVVHNCHASHIGSNVIWESSVWLYVFTCVLAAALFVPLFLVVSFERGFVALSWHLARINKARNVRRDAVYVKWGDDLPDWLFLSHGLVLIGTAGVLSMMAFCGYWELFVTKPWCEDRHVAFEQLGIWQFGRFSFVLQIVAAFVFLAWGILWWLAPVFMECTRPTLPLATMDDD